MLTTLFSVVSASAQTIIVTPANATSLGWSTADTRPGGAVAITGFADGQGGNGSLNLTTTSSTTAKAQYMHSANVPLSDVTELSFSTYQASASFAGGDASYQLPVCLDGITPAGACVGFTTLVYEPYQHAPGVIPMTWQSWNVGAEPFWSSRTYSSGACTVAGTQGPPVYTLAFLNTVCPNAVAVGFGVNIGSNNPDYNVYADYVNFNGTTYNFELFEVATSKDQCKKGGWMTVTRADGSSFKNQGDCVSYTNNGK